MNKDKVRLDRILAYMGIDKRENVKQMIKEQLILVNNRIVKTNSYIKDKDVISVTTDEYIIVFEVNLTFEDNKILLAVNPLKKERVKVYTC